MVGRRIGQVSLNDLEESGSAWSYFFWARYICARMFLLARVSGWSAPSRAVRRFITSCESGSARS